MVELNLTVIAAGGGIKRTSPSQTRGLADQEEIVRRPCRRATRQRRGRHEKITGQCWPEAGKLIEPPCVSAPSQSACGCSRTRRTWKGHQKGVRKPTDGFKFTMCQMVTQSLGGFTQASRSTTRVAAIAVAWSASTIRRRLPVDVHARTTCGSATGGVGGASGTDAARAVQHLQQLGRVTAALSAPRSARHLPVHGT